MTQLRTALQQYYVEYSTDLPADPARIMAALCGSNDRKIIFFEAPASRFNSRGEYLDPWGTPFRIDASNYAFPWAYSCGPNRRDEGAVPGSDDIASWR